MVESRLMRMVAVAGVVALTLIGSSLPSFAQERQLTRGYGVGTDSCGKLLEARDATRRGSVREDLKYLSWLGGFMSGMNWDGRMNEIWEKTDLLSALAVDGEVLSRKTIGLCWDRGARTNV